ncbi:hypothetical protein LJB83_03150 [Clostridia bacterium OttesenSCG-928-F22]|nr:hypothetical protein [Clostridia bacterium OttesenSCG-928-F22]
MMDEKEIEPISSETEVPVSPSRQNLDGHVTMASLDMKLVLRAIMLARYSINASRDSL